jgi:hypothetical protein
MVPNPKIHFHFVPNFHMVFVFVKFAETLRRHVGGFHLPLLISEIKLKAK